MTAPLTLDSFSPNCSASLAASWGRVAAYAASAPARAIPAFELTDADLDEYEAKVALGHGDMWLSDKVNAHDFRHRQIVGVWGALSPAGKAYWQEEWLADLPGHMARACDALDRAYARRAAELRGVGL